MTRHPSHTSIQAQAEVNSLSTDSRKQEGFRSKHFIHTRNMPDMSTYIMASQQNSTTQSTLFKGSGEPYITCSYRQGSHDPTPKSYKHTSTSGSKQSEYRLQKARRLPKHVYLHRALHGQNHHLGGKLLIDVEVYIRALHGQNHHLGGKLLIDVEVYIKLVGGGGVFV